MEQVRWITVDIPDDCELHILPVDKDEQMIGNHQPVDYCFCCPMVDYVDESIVIVHNNF